MGKTSELQVKYPRLNLLGLTHVPEVLSEVTAGTAGNIHLAVVLIAALRALPLVVVIYYYLTIEAAYMAVIRLGVKLRILDVVIDEAYNLLHGIYVVAHVRYLHIRYASAG